MQPSLNPSDPSSRAYCTASSASFNESVYIQLVSTSPKPAAPASPAALRVIGIFLLFGSTMALLAGATLTWKGTAFDRIWLLNPFAYQRLAPFGKLVGIPFLLLSGLLALAAVGWFKRRLWGWWLTVAIRDASPRRRRESCPGSFPRRRNRSSDRRRPLVLFTPPQHPLRLLFELEANAAGELKATRADARSHSSWCPKRGIGDGRPERQSVAA